VTCPEGTSLVLVNVAGLVVVNLPDVQLWMIELASRPQTAFDRSIWVKDIGGHAGAFPIVVDAFGAQTIDTQATYTISTNYGVVRLYPLEDLTGWFVG